MKKVYVFYIATLGTFFAALLSIFSLLGLGQSPPQEIPGPIAPEPPPEPRFSTALLDHPDLLPGEMYSVSHKTEIASDPEGVIGNTEILPPHGIFRVDALEESGTDLWYRVTVNNGRTDYTMYLKAEELNWKSVELAFDEEKEQEEISQEEAMSLLTEYFSRGRPEGTQPETVPEPLPEPPAFERAWAALQHRGTTVSSGGIWTAALAAGLVTLATALAIGMVVWSYKVRRWHTSGIEEEPGFERGEEFYEEEEPMENPADQF